VVISFINHAIRKKKGILYIHRYKLDHPITPKQVVSIVDLGYLGVEKDFQEHYHPPCLAKRREIWIYLKKKTNTIKVILKRE
jgi:hypothetical protein